MTRQSGKKKNVPEAAFTGIQEGIFGPGRKKSAYRRPLRNWGIMTHSSTVGGRRLGLSKIRAIWSKAWLYLAVIIDLYSRLVVGWSMFECMAAQLVCGALKMAMWRRPCLLALLYIPVGVASIALEPTKSCSRSMI